MTKQPLEKHSWQTYCKCPEEIKPLIEADQLLHIVDSSGGTLNPEYKDFKNCVKLLENQEFRQDFLKCWKEGRLDEVGNLALLRSRRNGVTSPSRDDLDIAQQEEATLDAWSIEFKGKADTTLWKHIKGLYTRQPVYALYTAIVQSSGMGKSRVTDELAKKRFVIPICLRPPGSTGFPPPDVSAYDFLLGHCKNRSSAHFRAVAFLCALFSQAAEEVRAIRSDQNNKDQFSTAQCFRDRMTNNQSAKRANQYRRNFFASVTQRASEILPHVETFFGESASKRLPPRGLENALVSDFTDLVKALQATSALPTPAPTEVRFSSAQESVMEKGFKKCNVNTGQADEPLVVLVLDEAHLLSEIEADKSGLSWSRFGELRRALRILKEMPLFTLFLSTTGKITQFDPSQDKDRSARVVQQKFQLLPPFTDLGFDSLVQPLPNTITLETMTREKFMAQFGRPLFASRRYKGARSVKQSIIVFAVGKLLNIPQVGTEELDKLSKPQKLACLSQRLPLEFYPSNNLDRDEMEQVECHMRIYLKIDPILNTTRSISASEPLLSEAAYAIMQGPNFNAPDALLSVMTTFPIHKGDRGEILTLLLLTLARDACVRSNNPDRMDSILVSLDDNRRRIISIIEFTKQLLDYQNLFPESPAKDPTKPARLVAKESEPCSTREHFEEDFKDAYLHFNHCIKAHNQASIDRRYLPSFLIRGAAMLCPSSQKAVDIVVPFLLEKDVAYKDWKSVLSFILVQVKNDAGFGTFKEWYFDEMDPYQLGILQSTDEPVNFIRIFFSLVTPTPGLRIKRTKLTSPSKTDYYAYDIWCAGIDPSFLVPIKGADKRTWEALLDASTSWQDIYKSDNEWVKERAYQNPCAASREEFHHWLTRAEDNNMDVD